MTHNHSLEPGTIYAHIDDAVWAATCLCGLHPDGVTVYGTSNIRRLRASEPKNPERLTSSRRRPSSAAARRGTSQANRTSRSIPSPSRASRRTRRHRPITTEGINTWPRTSCGRLIRTCGGKSKAKAALEGVTIKSLIERLLSRMVARESEDTMTPAQKRMINEIWSHGGDDEYGAPYWDVANDWVKDKG